jgi:putative hemolysin
MQKARLSGDRQGVRVLRLLGKPAKLLSTVLFGNTLVNVAASAVATVIAADLVPGSLGLGLAVVVMTFLLLVFGEISPKTFAVANAESWARRTSGIMEVLTRITTPVSATLSWMGRLAARLTSTTDTCDHLSRSEILSLMELGQSEGVLGVEANVTVAFLSLNEKQCDQAMVPRSSAVCLRRDWDRERMTREIRSTGFTRFPLIEGAGENVLGYIDAREFLIGSGELLVHDIEGFPETAPLGGVLEQLRKSGSGIGAVFDEYGDWTGIITTEDILETVVYQKLEDGSGLPSGVHRRNGGFEVPASIRLDSLSVLLERDVSAKYAETAGGLIEEVTGRIPVSGEKLEVCGCWFTVLEARGPRLIRLSVLAVEPESAQ